MLHGRKQVRFAASLGALALAAAPTVCPAQYGAPRSGVPQSGVPQSGVPQYGSPAAYPVPGRYGVPGGTPGVGVTPQFTPAQVAAGRQLARQRAVAARRMAAGAAPVGRPDFPRPAYTPPNGVRTAAAPNGYGGPAYRGPGFQAGPAAPPAAPPSADGGGAAVGGPAFVGVMGAVATPGCYEFSGAAGLAELMHRCGGASTAGTGELIVIRDGRAAASLEYRRLMNPELRGGDVLIFVRSPNAAADAAADGTEKVQLALVGLIDRPVVLNVAVENATIPRMLELLGQSHLAYGSFEVLYGTTGVHAWDARLPGGSVFSFKPGRVNPETVPQDFGDLIALQPQPDAAFSAAAADGYGDADGYDDAVSVHHEVEGADLPLPAPGGLAAPVLPAPDGFGAGVSSPSLPVITPVAGRPRAPAPPAEPGDGWDADGAASARSPYYGGDAGSGRSTAVPEVTLLPSAPDEPHRSHFPSALPALPVAGGRSDGFRPDTAAAEPHLITLSDEPFDLRAPLPADPNGGSDVRVAALPPAPSSASDRVARDRAGAAPAAPAAPSSGTPAATAATGVSGVLWVGGGLIAAGLLAGAAAAGFASRRREAVDADAAGPHEAPTEEFVAAPAAAAVATPRAAATPLEELIADRVPVVEETLTLPTAVTLHGRTTGLDKLRLDPPQAAVAAPHFAKAGAAANRRESVAAGERAA